MADTQAEPGFPFANDLLGRKAAAEFLTRYLVGRHRVAGSVPGNESFVLNVNAEWGLGKTYFLTEWAKMLRAEGHPVVLFDAWENDFSSNPFVGFMTEVEKQLTKGMDLKQKAKSQARAVITKGARVIKASAPSIALTVVKNFTGLDAQNLIEEAKKSSPDITSAIKRDLEKENKNIRNAISDFKSALAQFAIDASEGGKASLPVFLMVDEMDRCRPSYAIELLENIKHIFRVPNVYTIVATDSEQLAHSIRAIYGEGFDYSKYLRRFFDHESRLDKPRFKELITALMTVRKLDNTIQFSNPLETIYGRGAVAEVLALLAQALKVTTRDLERVIDIIDSIRITTHHGVFDILYLGFLTMLYVTHQTMFDAYARDKNGHSLQQKLSQVADHSAVFNEINATEHDYDGRRQVRASVIDWLCRYVSGVWSATPYENNDSWVGLKTAIQNSTRSDSSFISLREYHNLITMAGHFSV
ncbi:P-loop NTPase fold protein [Caballeronia sp. LZ043]|uniref:KAP family P-loop NTPase fold protein n=1 Tax=Caballeronia sp. LZ043 TaxID=3038569 RepID=UPI002863D7E2|nr:P-loop NTPase fold protein [Caballeronia sp. LZ043]MDR5819839.1 P-loop NTPase fold protein [Caballeronia sp. LZ043]